MIKMCIVNRDYVQVKRTEVGTLRSSTVIGGYLASMLGPMRWPLSYSKVCLNVLAMFTEAYCGIP